MTESKLTQAERAVAEALKQDASWIHEVCLNEPQVELEYQSIVLNVRQQQRIQELERVLENVMHERDENHVYSSVHSRVTAMARQALERMAEEGRK